MFLRKVADFMQGAQNIIHPLHPIQSVSKIAVGALSLLSVPFTGTIGLINGIAGISQGSLDAAQDLAEAGCTLSKVTSKTGVTKLEAAHLTVSIGVIAIATFAALNPVVAFVAAKTSAIVISKSLLTGLCIL
jgi:hypothetical protein